ncbi:unnamed protein product [Caretta caretta]
MHILQGVPQPQPVATLLRPLTVLSSISHVTSNYGHIRGIVTTELKEDHSKGRNQLLICQQIISKYSPEDNGNVKGFAGILAPNNMTFSTCKQ